MRKLKRITISIGVSVMLTMVFALSAFADGGTNGSLAPTITAGGLTAVNYADYNSGAPTIDSLTLDGQNTSLAVKMPLTITDARGSGAGWAVYVFVQQFAVGTTPSTFHTIPNDAITFTQAVADSGTGSSGTPLGCDSQSTCSLPATRTSGGTQVSVEPASLVGSDPSYSIQYDTGHGYTGTKIAEAGANTGMGKMYIEADFTVALPANTTYAGAYQSTFTISFNNAP